MGQAFTPSWNTWGRVIWGGLFALPVIILFACYGVLRSSWQTGEGLVVDQPVPFSHEHHVRGLGIDCRYCHTSVIQSSFAGIPPTKTCMTCHSKVWYEAPLLATERDSWATQRPVEWQRVHKLPDYVYFDHSIHVAKGIGCASCHGQVERMPLMQKGASLQMRWCIECHRQPWTVIRPREEVFSMQWQAPANQAVVGRELVRKYHVRPPEEITRCSVCHR